jgi:thioester reductase-like protein
MIDVVYHVAADVNWVQPYAALRDVNVIGTLEMLRLAAAARPKPVHFVSSLSVGFIPDGPVLIEETTDCLPFVDRLPLGYAATKCVAEALCRQAAARGLPVHVLRPGLVTGDSRTGASNAGDLVSRLVLGCIRMGVAPDLDWTLDATPVDEVARAVADAPVPTAAVFACTHVTAHRPRTWQDCVLWINLHGYPCRLRPFDEWRAVLDAQSVDSGHPLHPLRSFFLRHAADGASPAELYQVTRRSAVSPGSFDPRSPEPSPRTDVDAGTLSLYLDYYASPCS